MARSSTQPTRTRRKTRSAESTRAVSAENATTSDARRNGREAKGSAAKATQEPEALVVTQWFDSGEGGEPYAATIRFTGQRVGVRRPQKSEDTFVKEETVECVIPGTGPISVTSTVHGVEPGEWAVAGQVLRAPNLAERPRPAGRSRFAGAEATHPATWSWRTWSLAIAPEGPLKTRWALLAPLAQMPAVLPGLFTLLVALGGAVLVSLQVAILVPENVPVDRVLLVSMLAMVSGVAGAKLWYAHLHPGPWRQQIIGGWAVDGFLLVALAVAVGASIALDVPTGLYLDATSPGLFFAVAIGRIGCFFTGCCAGRCTGSRWGVWSSDRRVGARRIPTQLMESAAGLVLAIVTTLLVLGHVVPVSGAVFFVSFTAYFFLRQSLLRLRAERREYSWRRSQAAVVD